MIVDVEGSSATSWSGEVVIVGAGPVGITLALELGRAGIDVILVESGRRRGDAAVQSLGDAEIVDPLTHAPMDEATCRILGGASRTWGGRCVPYDDVDFADRPWYTDARWPIGHDEVRRYYGRAGDYARCGRPVFSAHESESLRRRSLVPGADDGDVRFSDLERWSLPTDFGRFYRDELERSARVRLLLGLTCVELVQDEALPSRVGIARCADIAGGERFVKGRRMVVCAGGIESTRLLLCSDGRLSGGLGSSSGHLGRYYMGHLSGTIASIAFSTDPQATIYSHERDDDRTYVRRRITFSEDCQQREQLPNTALWLVNPELPDPSHGHPVLSFAYLILASPLGRYLLSPPIRNRMLKGAASHGTWRHWRNLLAGCFSVPVFIVRFGYQRFVATRKAPGFFVRSAGNVYPLHFHAEHAPHPDSRIVLAETCDRLGMRRVRIDLRFTDEEIRRIVRAHQVVDRSLKTLGIGELRFLEGDPLRRVREQAADGFHQSGSTRMAAKEQDGVVDSSLRVFGTENLYVASGSVLPTSGQANTTFVVLALALRLADHLRESLN